MSVVAAAVVTSAAVGVYSANKSAKAANQATDAASAAASEQNQLSREQFEWNKQIYERDTAPMQKQQMEMQTRIAEDALARAKKQDALADEQNQYYKDTFQPVERKVVADAMGYDSDENINRRTGIAAANVNQQFSNARGQSARLAGRYGLGSTAFSGPAGAAERAQALGTAGAATGAAFDTMDKGIQLRSGVANFGRNMPNTALTGWNGATNSGSAAGNAANSALSGTISATAGLNSAYNNRFNGIGASTNMLTNSLNNSANYWGNAASGFGSLAGGLFQKSGGFGSIGSLGGFGTALKYGTNFGSEQTNMLAAQEAGMF